MDGSDIPIDIHYNKLLDWLLNRRHCGSQWQAACLKIRQKINAALQLMPEHPDITNLLAGTYINYFHCERIVEILRDTEATSKNLFGRYSSQRMKDWQQIVTEYRRDDIYLGEAAQLLTRCVNYEIPELKRRIKQCQQQQQDCTRKEKQHASNAAQYREQYTTQCKKMNIQGQAIIRELMNQVRDLPTTYNEIGESMRDLEKAAQFYSDFIRFTLKDSCDLADEAITLVKYMCRHGNTTLLQYRTGRVPSRVEEPELDFGPDEEPTQAVIAESDTIDFGDGEIDFGGEIDFNITLEDGCDPAAEIDFGDLGDTGAIESVDIQVVDDSTQPEQSTGDVGVARGEEARSLLDHVTTRNALLNELLELQCFLSCRLAEMRLTDLVSASLLQHVPPALHFLQCFLSCRLAEMRSTDLVSASLLQHAPPALHFDREEVEKMKCRVADVVARLTDSRLRQLMMIRNSPRYVDRVSERLRAITTDTEKQMSLSRLMVTRREEARQNETDLYPQLDLIRGKMKELQRQIETEISKKYKNRRVNIMGEINTI